MRSRKYALNWVELAVEATLVRPRFTNCKGKCGNIKNVRYSKNIINDNQKITCIACYCESDTGLALFKKVRAKSLSHENNLT